MLTKVEPASKGIPHFKEVYISNIKATGAKKAVNAIGLQESALQNFHFNNVQISAATAGEVKFADGWTWENNSITTIDNSTLTIPNLTETKQ